MKALIWRELKALYAGAGGWLALAAVQLLTAWLLFAQLELYLKLAPRLSALDSPLGMNDLVFTPTLAGAALMLLLATPLLGMQSLAGELRSGRMALLLAAPLSARRLVLGKWLGLWLTALPLALPALVMTLILGLGSHLDGGRWLASALALALVSGLAAAWSLWFSSLTDQPILAAALAWGLLGLAWLVDADRIPLLSLRAHLQPLLEGLVTSEALLWFGLLTLAPLALCVHRLWRLQGGD